MDAKGRIAIPGKWRDLVTKLDDPRLVLTRFVADGERCLDVYPYGEWSRLEERIMEKARFNRNVVKFENYYIASAHDCPLDRQGRILVPPHLRDYAALTKDVVFAGVLAKFRLFGAEGWTRVERAAEQSMVDDPEFLESLDL